MKNALYRQLSERFEYCGFIWLKFKISFSCFLNISSGNTFCWSKMARLRRIINTLSDEGLMLEMSAFKLFMVANLHQLS